MYSALAYSPRQGRFLLQAPRIALLDVLADAGLFGQLQSSHKYSSPWCGKTTFHFQVSKVSLLDVCPASARATHLLATLHILQQTTGTRSVAASHMECETRTCGLLIILKALQGFLLANQTLIDHDLNSSTTVRGLKNSLRMLRMPIER